MATTTRGSARFIAPLLMILLVGSVVGSLWAIRSLRAAEQESDRRQFAVGELVAEAHALDGLEWRAIAGEDLGELRPEIRDGARALTRKVGRLLPALAIDDALELRYQAGRYTDALQRELDALEAGDLARARVIDRNVVDKAFPLLEEQLARTNAAFEADGVEASSRGDRLTWLLVGGELAVSIGLVLIVNRIRRRGHDRRVREDFEARFRSLVESATSVISAADDAGTVTFFSPNWASIFPEASPQTDIADLLDPASESRWREAVADLHRSGQSVRLEFALADGDEPRVVEGVGSLLADGPDHAWMWTDVTEQRVLQDQLAHQAFHDSLTGLPNRALFTNRLEHALAASRRSQQSVCLLLADLDEFKAVNDGLGHAAGDELLQVVASRLLQCTRAGETVARLGGDEFAILVESDVASATRLAARIIDHLPTEVRIDDSRLYPRLSIGVAVAAVGAPVGEVFRHADMAMYDAKSSGRSRWCLYDENVADAGRRNLDLVADLEQAIRDEQFVLHYQPTVTLTDGTIDGFEALVRWQHPERGLIPPNDFLPLAEANGQIIPIGSWVIRQACEDAARLSQEAGRPVPIHINVSVHQLRNDHLVDEFAAAIARAGIEPTALVVEVTEGVLLDNRGAIDRLHELHNLGIRIAIDDFGTGYTSIAYLRTLPIDILKIDRGFVSGDAVPERERDALLTGILGLARGLSLRSVAEGIETDEQRARLTALGVDDGQGFLFARPVPIDQLIGTEWMGRDEPAAPPVPPAPAGYSVSRSG